MKRNDLIAVGAIAVFTLSACMAPRAPGAAQERAAAADNFGPGGIQGQGPHGADPNAYYHRLSSVEQGGR